NGGTVFSINTDGRGFAVLEDFSDRFANPNGGLVLSGSTLYGTTPVGGSAGRGTVFAINNDGSGYTVLKNFGWSEAANPGAGLVLSSNTLYGKTVDGGSSGYGTVFAINTDRTGVKTLYTFTGCSDGAYPIAGLVLSGNTMYGTAASGGNLWDRDPRVGYGSGAVFALNTDGTGFTTLYNFTAISWDSGGSFRTNYDGANPSAALILSGNTLYGTAQN